MEVTRVESIDIAKGLLVVAMVAHHSWGAFGGDKYGTIVWEILGFVTPSFITLAGFGFGRFLLKEYWHNTRRRVVRDIGRGGRMAVLFFVPNVAAYFVDYRGISGRYDLSDWLTRLVVGVPPDEAVFEVLGAFVTFFVTASAFLGGTTAVARLGLRWGGYCRIVAVGSAVLAIWILVASALNQPSLHPLVGFGFAGMAVSSALQLIREKSDGGGIWAGGNGIQYFWKLSLLLFMFFLCLGLWFERFPLSREIWMPIYTASMLVVFASCKNVAQRFGVKEFLLWLGKYSLFAYVVQVTAARLLQIIDWQYFIFHHGLVITYVLASVCVMVIMLASLVAVERVRRLSKSCDKAYRAVFG